MAQRPPYTINFRFVGNAQTLKAVGTGNKQSSRDSRGRFQKMQEMFNTIVDDVALNSADRTYKTAKARLEKDVEGAVQREIAQMATMVGRFLVQPNRAKGPRGQVSSKEIVISDQARSIFGRENITGYDVSRFGAQWSPRTKGYMDRKKKDGYPAHWWLRKGDLKRTLRQPGLYKELGPVSVRFEKTTGKVNDFKVRQTSSGRKGSVSATYSVGRLTVKAMERVSLEMLANSLSGQGTLVPSLFKDKKLAGKLMSHGKSQYRPVLEPFLFYYLTRAIPNAAFVRTEKLISDSSATRGSRTGGSGKSLGLGNAFS